MSGSEFTLSGFSDFLERRCVTFVNPRPNIRSCGVCGIAPSRSLLLSCGEVLCEPCRVQLKGQALCPFHNKDCLAADVVMLDLELSQLETYGVLCPNGDNCTFTGTLSVLKEHLVNCSSEKVKCLKCSERVARRVAIDHRRRCSGAADPRREVSTLGANGSLLREVQNVKKGVEALLELAHSDEFERDNVVSYVNSPNLLAERLADFERDFTRVQQIPVGSRQNSNLASTIPLLPFGATPCRAASKPNAFVTMCEFCDIYGGVKSLAKEQKLSITHAFVALGGYSFQLECVLELGINEEVGVCFTFRLGDGRWADRLSWPFARAVTIILTHPTESQKDIQLPVRLSGYEMTRKPAPGSWNEGSTTQKVSFKHVELNGFVDNCCIYANVELA